MRAHGAAGSASVWHTEGQGFESPWVHIFLFFFASWLHLVLLSIMREESKLQIIRKNEEKNAWW